ncbi:hypothetical protein [Oxynema aestuarii]|jgi:DNA repair exonuclease SbcCD ATPase subunit|uniref:CopG family transcriptional regulator n=1 Tax=Oxynema aestuarii AP17 TaxID=2064643 RepID=A0A6H1TZ08_9CYAN|nr:hypothetical protein [Oxynema aestuarii]QIZ71848.1 hypothetical protein HCG48_15705 [Oxynema aestuarii AP17]RMH76687.1 MAG: hypothetical protein D6680_07600 [Cyanobacteria bacterium J007]
MTENFNLNREIPPDWHSKLEEIARLRQTSIDCIVAEAIAQYLGEDTPPHDRRLEVLENRVSQLSQNLDRLQKILSQLQLQNLSDDRDRPLPPSPTTPTVSPPPNFSPMDEVIYDEPDEILYDFLEPEATE